MKDKYFLFAGKIHYPKGGVYDLKGEFLSIEDAETKAKNPDNEYSWYHITDQFLNLIISRHYDDEDMNYYG